MRYGYVAASLAGMALSGVILSQNDSSSLSDAVASWAGSCADEIARTIETAEDRGDLETGAAFDRMYVPTPGTSPRQYKTSYDSWADQAIAPILKKTLNSRPTLLYVLLIDPNGYIPVAPAIRSVRRIPVPSIPKSITTTNSDLEAAKLTDPQLIRPIGSTPDGTVTEIAVPVMVRNRLWCVLRMGYIEK